MGSKTSFYVLEALMLAYRLARGFNGRASLIASVVLQTCIASVLDTECMCAGGPSMEEINETPMKPVLDIQTLEVGVAKTMAALQSIRNHRPDFGPPPETLFLCFEVPSLSWATLPLPAPEG